MTRTQRRWHLRIWIALAVIAPAILLWARSTPGAGVTPPTADPHPGGTP